MVGSRRVDLCLGRDCVQDIQKPGTVIYLGSQVHVGLLGALVQGGLQKSRQFQCLRLTDVFAATLIAARNLKRFTRIASLVRGFKAASMPSGALESATAYKLARAIEIPCHMTSATSPGYGSRSYWAYSQISCSTFRNRLLPEASLLRFDNNGRSWAVRLVESMQ